MSLVREQAAKVMRAKAGLHGDDAGWDFCSQANEGLSLRATAQNDGASFVETDDAAKTLAKIDAEHGNLHDSSLRFEPPANLQRRMEGRAIP
jgi:hypothetical protein